MAAGENMRFTNYIKEGRHKHKWVFEAEYGHPRGSNYGVETIYRCEICDKQGRSVTKRNGSESKITLWKK
jgi:hypothetical protein